MRRPDEAGESTDMGLREIPTWAKRYAQNRTLPVLMMLLIFAAGYAAFGGLSYLTAWAYRDGHLFLAASAMLVLSGFAVWWMWFCFVGGAAIMRRISERLYQREGGAIAAATCQAEEHGRLPLAICVFMFCVLASLGLGLLGLYPISLMQPVSALYVVPFLCYLGLKLRRVGSPFMFLWPALYGIHAILMVGGAPIRLGPAFDITVPMLGYGLLAALAGHIYSRIALRRIRSLARIPETAER
jgi:hypothetical protein